jgi:hypothetical protein
VSPQVLQLLQVLLHVRNNEPHFLLSVCMRSAVLQFVRPSNMVDHVADILQLEGRPDRRPVQVSQRK